MVSPASYLRRAGINARHGAFNQALLILWRPARCTGYNVRTSGHDRESRPSRRRGRFLPRRSADIIWKAIPSITLVMSTIFRAGDITMVFTTLSTTRPPLRAVSDAVFARPVAQCVIGVLPYRGG